VRIAVALDADVRIVSFFRWISVVERFALLAIAAHCVVLAAVADSARYPSGGFVHGRIVVAAIGVVVAVASFAGVGLATDGRPPRQVVVEIFTLLAIEALGVVGALAAAVDHVGARVHARKR